MIRYEKRAVDGKEAFESDVMTNFHRGFFSCSTVRNLCVCGMSLASHGID